MEQPSMRGSNIAPVAPPTAPMAPVISSAPMAPIAPVAPPMFPGQQTQERSECGSECALPCMVSPIQAAVSSLLECLTPKLFLCG